MFGGLRNVPRQELRAAALSIAVSVVLLAIKFVAYYITSSAAIFSDALESIVNVFAASFALYSVVLAHLPADHKHPYGHGKIEFLSAGFEGGMIVLAGLGIAAAVLWSRRDNMGRLAGRSTDGWLRRLQSSDADTRREAALAVLHREPELIDVQDVAFRAHALVVPSADPEERQRFDAQAELIAVAVAIAHEEARGAVVRDVSTAERARAAGLDDWPGFDLLSHRPGGDPPLAIEVKGRAGRGPVELTANEFARSCNLGPRYWLYVVYDCAKPSA